ncbi:hypothetical protein CROQUDRAFT_52838, partial [Cronartium quercuum f. sp. fusiforme G11]
METSSQEQEENQQQQELSWQEIEESSQTDDSEGKQQNVDVIEWNEYENSSDDFQDVGNKYQINTIEICLENHKDIALLQAEAEVPQTWNKKHGVEHIVDARLMLTRPIAGKAHTMGHHSLTTVIINNKEAKLLLDSGASCSVVGSRYLNEIVPDWKDMIIPCTGTKFSGCGGLLFPLGIIMVATIFPHTQGAVRIQPEFVVMENATTKYFILGSDFLSIYGFDILHSREKYFTIGNENKRKKFALSQNKHILPIYHDENDNKSLEMIKTNKDMQACIAEAEFGPKLLKNQKKTIEDIIIQYAEQFGLIGKEIGTIVNHPVHISLNIEKPYPPILRKAAYPASPRNRIEIEKHIDELLKLGIIRKVGEAEEVDVTTPIIITWHNGKSRL